MTGPAKAYSIVVAIFPLLLGSIAVRGEDALKIEVAVAPELETIFTQRDVTVSVTSKVGGIQIREVILVTDGLLSRARPDINSISANSSNSSSLAENEAREYRFNVPPIEWGKIASSPFLMRFPGGTQVLRASVHFDQPIIGERTQLQRFSMGFSVDVFSIALGGCVGGFLAAIFVLIVRWRDDHQKVHLIDAAKEISLNMAVGLFAAAILTYLGDMTKQLNVGVTLSATSFQGGVVVGLLSYKFAQALLKGITAPARRPKGPANARV